MIDVKPGAMVAYNPVTAAAAVAMFGEDDEDDEDEFKIPVVGPRGGRDDEPWDGVLQAFCICLHLPATFRYRDGDSAPHAVCKP